MSPLLPLFLKLAGRPVLVVGGGPVAAGRVRQLLEAGARVTVVAPEVRPEIVASGAAVGLRPFAPADLDGAWLAVAAATPAVNRAVAAAAEARRVFVNAVDDPASATAFTGGVVRKGGAVLALSTGGRAPALAGLLREALEALLPEDVERWVELAERLRREQRAAGVPLEARRPLLLEALDGLYGERRAPSPWPSPPVGERERMGAVETPRIPTHSGAHVQQAGDLLPLPPQGGEGQGEGGYGPALVPSPAVTHLQTALDPLPLPPRGGESQGGAGLGSSPPSSRSSGSVSIVGAGPGDPGLLTRKAERALAEADLVLHDALVTPEILALCPRARRFPVGKRAGRPGIAQESIHRLLVASARAGKRVVRLKAGDPFVLGRGGEEALALGRAGIPYEIVPGVSAALAAPALAGIPVTHRGLASGFAVVSGHDPSAWGPVVDGLPPGALTLVVLMGLGARAALAGRLLARGWPAATPAAALLAASTPDAFRWLGTLGELGEAPLPADGAPGTLVIGAVAALGSAIAPHARPARDRPAAAAGA